MVPIPNAGYFRWRQVFATRQEPASRPRGFEGRCVVWEGEPECVGVRNLWKGARTVGLDIVRDEKARFIGTQGIWGVPNSRCVTTTELSQT